MQIIDLCKISAIKTILDLSLSALSAENLKTMTIVLCYSMSGMSSEEISFHFLCLFMCIRHLSKTRNKKTSSSGQFVACPKSFWKDSPNKPSFADLKKSIKLSMFPLRSRSRSQAGIDLDSPPQKVSCLDAFSYLCRFRGW